MNRALRNFMDRISLLLFLLALGLLAALGLSLLDKYVLDETPPPPPPAITTPTT
ncbi:MAG: hypothetical protein ACYC6B_09140 [Thermoleophilia bacterium]